MRIKLLVAALLASLAVSYGSFAVAATIDESAVTSEQRDAQLQEARDHIKELQAQRNNLKDAVGAEPDGNGQYQAGDFGAAAELPPDEFAIGVIKSRDDSQEDIGGVTVGMHTFAVLLTSGKEKGTTVTVKSNDLDVTRQQRPLNQGDRVVVVKSYQEADSASYFISDNYRLPTLLLLVAFFFAVAVALGRWRGLTSVFGLASSVAVIMWYVVPRLAEGYDPLTVCVTAAFGIAATSLYLAHGFNRRTTVAFVSTVLTLGFSTLMAVKFVTWSHLFGAGTEDVLFLQGNGYDGLDLRGLLLGGIILGVLGILDDITTAQAAIVEELKAANPSFGFRELYRRGQSVGKEHIASLINTLFLAYAGASLPLFLLFSANSSQPLWLIVNSESIAQEMVRTLVGSICLILAVPVTTAIAAWHYDKRTVTSTHGGAAHRH